MPKERKADLSFLYVTCHLVLFYISTKYHQNILKGIRVTERTKNLFQTKQREITLKVRKPELFFLYATCHLILFYISTKYHQNIPKDIQVAERTRNFKLVVTDADANGICPKNKLCLPTIQYGWVGGDIMNAQISWHILTV